MDKRDKKKSYIIYPEYAKKNTWDLSIGLILIISCSVTPVHIAFWDLKESVGVWFYISIIFDCLFGIDIIV